MKQMKRIKRLYRWLAALALTLCLGLAATATAEAALPEGVAALCEGRYPGYEIAVWDGTGDEAEGEFALVLHKAGDNVLCVVRKAAGEAAYAFTLENTSAVYDEDERDFPSLRFEGDGDLLVYTYTDENGSFVSFSAKRDADGVWGCVTATVRNGSFQETSELDAKKRWLCYTAVQLDKSGSVLSETRLAPLPVTDEYAAQSTLARFDISQRSLWAQSGMSPCPALALLPYDVSPLGIDLKQNGFAVTAETTDGRRMLFLYDLDGEAYTASHPVALPQGASLDTFHTGERELFIGWEGNEAYFERGADGAWRYKGGYGLDGFTVGGEWVRSYADETVYGMPPWKDLLQTDVSALPRSFAEACAALDQTGYALVSNPNPADRLHLREKPAKSARSLGKFYNGTWVQILETKDAWVRVRIGRLEGWMMREYLRDATEPVEPAFPQLFLRDEEAAYPLYARPSVSADVLETIPGRDGCIDCITGVSGDEWFVVRLLDGKIGYMKQAWFWEGNG